MSDVELLADIDRTFCIDTRVNLYPPTDEPLRLIPPILGIVDCGIDELSARPAIRVHEVDPNYPLTQYYVSSSHNTYLLSRQLVGKSTAESYRHILQRHGCCVEIDAWPAKRAADGPATCEEEEPTVTHGYTLSKSIPFRSVCRAINGVVDNDSWPVMISVECHVDLKGQEDMVRIMTEEFGDKLVNDQLENVDDERVCPADMMGRVLCMVYRILPPPNPDEDSSFSSSSSDSDSEASQTPPEVQPSKISPSLASLGFYARSLKPHHPTWISTPSIFTPPTYPRHILINISEAKIHSYPLQSLWTHGLHHLRRVFPKGTRIRSSNMDIIRCWRNGSHVVSVNWQEYDRGMQVNEAMFVGTDGWVLKPALDEPKRMVRMSLRVVGLSDLPGENLGKHLYARVQLFHSAGDQKVKTKSVKPTEYPNGVVGVMWDQTFEFDVEWDELAFLRLLVMEDEFGRDDKVAVFCARVGNLCDGWRVWRLLDMKGKWKGSSVLVNWTLRHE
ncbi:PLC-like phosphodiesterase [Hymenopellis radicata]|nr:PLC-like phosphodiesterase [Hymenopellis radicata]